MLLCSGSLIEYKINAVSRECVAGDLKTLYNETTFDGHLDGDDFKMYEPKQFFHLTDSMTYKGLVRH